MTGPDDADAAPAVIRHEVTDGDDASVRVHVEPHDVPDDGPHVHPTVDRVAAYSWRLVVIATAVVGVLLLLERLLPVVLPIVIGLLLARALVPVYSWLRRRRLPRAVSAALSVLILVLVLAGTLAGIGASVATETDSLGTTVTQGIDDVERWLVEDSPFEVSAQDARVWRGEIEARLEDVFRSSADSVATGAVFAGELLVGAILSLIICFFVLKDRERVSIGVLRSVRPVERDRIRRVSARAWAALGGYLRGAALLGIVEAVAIGVAMFFAGARLVIPVMMLTFIGAFVPIVGAIAAGILAVLVTLVTAGVGPALAVAIVAVVVQQFDNDLLAPLIYGRAVQLNALTILLGIATGTALFGFVGTFLAVPVLAVTLNVIDELRHGPKPDPEPDQPTGPAVDVAVDTGPNAGRTATT